LKRRSRINEKGRLNDMQITVEISEEKFTNLVRQRIEELFSNDARFRETAVRDLLRIIVDEAAVTAVRIARDSIASELPAMATDAVRMAVKDDIEKAAKRGLGALRKLYAGFDPSKLTPEQRAWVEKQIAEAGNNRDE
jgi:hypothetical protein